MKICWNFASGAVQKYENLVDLENPEKNEYLVAIVAVDTAENGPPKVWRNWINYSVVSLIITIYDFQNYPLWLSQPIF